MALSLAALRQSSGDMPPWWMRSSISTTSTLAPPCNGPHKAHTAAAHEAKRFARDEPTTRAVDVLQFCSWSACRMKIRFRASSISGVMWYCW